MEYWLYAYNGHALIASLRLNWVYNYFGPKPTWVLLLHWAYLLVGTTPTLGVGHLIKCAFLRNYEVFGFEFLIDSPDVDLYLEV